MNAVLQAIQDRRSIRSYTKDKPAPDALAQILDAAQAAPSSLNKQPWHFSAVTNAGLLDAFNADFLSAVHGRLQLKEGYHVFYHAPAVIFLFTPEKEMTRFAQIDCGIAVENMAIAAHALGLGSVIVGSASEVFASERCAYYHDKLGVPEGYRFAIAIALGYPAQTQKAHPIREGMISMIE